MADKTETRIEQEFCPVFHKQVSIRINILRLPGKDQESLAIHTTYKCMDAVAAECLRCKIVNR